jgi:hypothetical protein
VKSLQKYHRCAYSPPRHLIRVYIKVKEYANGRRGA